jgi:hypothetical protein
MKFLASTFCIALLAFSLGIFLPWWSIAIAAFVVPLFIPMQPWKDFLSGFVALFFFWGIMSYIIDHSNGSLFSHKIALLILKTDNPMGLIAVTALIGAIVAGAAALSGSLTKRFFSK